ncbi:MAG: hypothetical protein HFF84_09795 [Oscillibacter sp.]|nr:hypothetical protein [Oscillibacter sp.]
MSMIHIQTAGGDSLARAEKMLSGIPGGMEKAVRSAMARSVSHLRTNSVKAVRERYDIAAADVRANENVTVRYSYHDGVQASILFAGRKIPLHRYGGAAPKYPVPGNPNAPAFGHQLKSTSPERFHSAFVARMPVSGHVGLFERTGGKDEIQEIMGSSVPQMLGSPEVEERLARESMEKFEDRLDHEINAFLNGWR